MKNKQLTKKRIQIIAGNEFRIRLFALICAVGLFIVLYYMWQLPELAKNNPSNIPEGIGVIVYMLVAAILSIIDICLFIFPFTKDGFN